ncbi:glycoside hydrolase family 115 protein [Rhodocollybia butyracea]|uniref:Glycoside hydrolase family 115 protein n=1 Tax=Rhodocollybia butyracea TaxID=206335 RepID=A0A9P5Q404_9AGAR|nr:glycoside hydrolase family 115 protein [Rhodocollybia butyracea]
MRTFSLTSFCFLLVRHVSAIGQTTCAVFQSSSQDFTFPVVQNGIATPVFVSPDDWPGVQIAASNFVADIERVTQILPSLSNVSASEGIAKSTTAIIVGTLGQSSLIEQVVNTTNLDVSSIRGLWESFIGQEVANPLPGVDSAYVIIGSDKRGTIFALYDLSEQFGVSPWYWWADVVPTEHSELFLMSSGCSHGEPTVQYRGIFLNDEQPALTNWAQQKYTNLPGLFIGGAMGTETPANASGTGSPFQSEFYSQVFELLLRLKGNYLWPAQWNSAFCVDDPLNQPLADLYGVVMGTSHEEPMMRSIPVEWTLFGDGIWDYDVNAQNIHNFWVLGVERARPYEGVFSIGMRGDGDLPIDAVNPIGTLETIIADQRQIFADIFNTTDVTTIPQMWTLYEEVEGYYEEGLTVPDDVVLLWTDDEHVDMVASPRDYKWVTSTQLSKLYEQLSLCVIRDAVRIWMLNVGDLKPYEREIEFWMALSWDSSVWNPDNVDGFVTAWAQREFKLDTSDAQTVAEVVANLTRYNARRKPELLNTTTYSLVNYREADRVVEAWDTLANVSTKIYNQLASDIQPSFFELVQHPVLASQTLGKMLIFAGQNNLRASQARLSTNELAEQVQELFEKDHDLEVEFHTLLDGKWDHMMDQTHVGYAYWQQPMTNTMPAVNRVQSRKQALPGVMRIIPEGSYGAWPGDDMFDCAQQFNCPAPTVLLDPFNPFGNVYIDVGSGGPVPFTWSATSNVSWLSVSTTNGSQSPSSTENRVFISVSDWSQLDAGSTLAQINFTAVASNQSDLLVPVMVEAQNTLPQVPSDFTGQSLRICFVESSSLGVVSFEAAHFARNTSVAGISWKVLPGLGRTLSSITPWPRDGDNGANFSAGTGPSVEYDFFVVSNITNLTVVTRLSPSLNANGPDRPLAYALQLNSQPIQTSYFIPPDSTPGGEPLAWGALTDSPQT